MNIQGVQQLLDNYEQIAESNKKSEDKKVEMGAFHSHSVRAQSTRSELLAKQFGVTPDAFHQQLINALNQHSDQTIRERIIRVIGHQDYPFYTPEEKAVLKQGVDRVSQKSGDPAALPSAVSQSQKTVRIEEADRAQFGGKGMFLNNMQKAGLPVPPFKTIQLSDLECLKQHPIPIEWVKRYIPELPTDDRSTMSLSEIELKTGQLSTTTTFDKQKQKKCLEGLQALVISEEFHGAIRHLPAAQTIERLSNELAKQCPGQAIIARSSGIWEDNYGDAQAGKFDSCVQEAEPILKTCLRVVSSGYRPEVCPQGKPQPITIVLQTCIDCEHGGVVISHGSLQDDAIQVEYGPGQPKGIVSGDAGITPHRYSIPREGADQVQWTEGHIARQNRLTQSADGHGFIEQPVEVKTTDLKSQQLPQSILVELKDAIETLEGMLCCPVDVEFAIGKDHKLYLLQVRPVTRLSGGNSYSVSAPDAPVINGTLVSEGCCSGQAVYVDSKINPDTLPKGAIVYTRYARDWMLEPAFLNRVGGFVLENGGTNDHVAITLRMNGKPCLLAGRQFQPPASSSATVTLVAGHFSGEIGAYVLAGDQAKVWSSHQISITPDYESAIQTVRNYRPSKVSFQRPDEGFAFLSQLNAQLLDYFHTNRLFHQCLSEQQSKILSMSPRRSEIAGFLQLEVEHFTKDMAAFLEGYEHFLSLAGETNDPKIQSYRDKLDLLRQKLDHLKQQVTEGCARVITPLHSEHSDPKSPGDYCTWLTACRDLKATLQSLEQSSEVNRIQTIYDAILYIHKRFVEALPGVALGSGQGKIIQFGSNTQCICVSFLNDGDSGLLNQVCLDALMKFQHKTTILNLPTAVRMVSETGQHTCEIEMFEQAEAGKGRKLRMVLADRLSETDHIDGKLKRFVFQIRLAQYALGLDPSRITVDFNAISGKVTLEYSPLTTREEMQDAFTKMLEITHSMEDVDFTLEEYTTDPVSLQSLQTMLEYSGEDSHSLIPSLIQLTKKSKEGSVPFHLLVDPYPSIIQMGCDLRDQKFTLTKAELMKWADDITTSSGTKTPEIFKKTLIEGLSGTYPEIILPVMGNKDKALVLASVKQQGLNLRCAHDDLKRDETIVMAAVKQNSRSLQYAHPDLRNNRDIVMAAVEQYGMTLQYAHDDLKRDEKIVMAAVKQHCESVQYAHPDLRNNRKIMMAVVEQGGLGGFCLKYAHDDLKRDEKIVMTAVNQNSGSLQYAHPDLRNNRYIVLAAITRNGMSLQYAHDDLKSDEKIVLAAVKQNSGSLQYAHPDLRNNRDIVMAAVEQCGLSLQYAHDDLKSDEKIVLAAVKQHGESLQYAHPDLRNNRDIVLAAVEQRGLSLKYASDELKNDEKVVMIAVKQNGAALEYANPRLQNDDNIVLAAVTQNGDALKYASDRLKKNKKIVLAAVKQNPLSVIYASNELQDDDDVRDQVFNTY